MIELAYEQAEAAGIVQLNEDEAGPYQAIPQPGASWQPEGHPALQPHEYERGGTAKLLTLFRPASGQIRAKGVVSERVREGFGSQLTWMSCFGLRSLSKAKRQVFSTALAFAHGADGSRSSRN